MYGEITQFLVQIQVHFIQVRVNLGDFKIYIYIYIFVRIYKHIYFLILMIQCPCLLRHCKEKIICDLKLLPFIQFLLFLLFRIFIFHHFVLFVLDQTEHIYEGFRLQVNHVHTMGLGTLVSTWTAQTHQYKTHLTLLGYILSLNSQVYVFMYLNLFRHVQVTKGRLVG